MKHKGHCMGLLRPTPFQFQLCRGTILLCFPASPIISCLRLLYRFFASRIFLLKYRMCVSRNDLLGRVSKFVASFFFPSPCVFLQIVFKKKAARNKGRKHRFLFSSPHFYLKIEKHLTFFKDISSDKKKGHHICQQS